MTETICGVYQCTDVVTIVLSHGVVGPPTRLWGPGLRRFFYIPAQHRLHSSKKLSFHIQFDVYSDAHSTLFFVPKTLARF